MAIRISEILFLVSAALTCASAFRKLRPSGFRLWFVETAMLLFLAVSEALLSRDAAVAGRTSGAIALLLAAVVTCAAAAIIAVRQARAQRGEDRFVPDR